MKMLAAFAKIVLLFLIIVVMLTPWLIQRVDRTPYTQTDFYKTMMKRFDSVHNAKRNETRNVISAGFAKVNMTPPFATPTAGYGKRSGKNFVGVHDSIYARTILLQKDNQLVAMVSCDLLIIPPELTLQLKKQLPSIGLDWNNVYISATHTHNSLGAWGKNYIGELFAGKYDQRVVDLLTKSILQSIEEAKKTIRLSRFAYWEMNADEFVKNRMNKEGTEDPKMRMIAISQLLGKNVLLLSYAAHSTTLSDTVMSLSRDYPGALIDSVEKKDSIDFAIYMAGDVGSMGPDEHGKNDWEQLTNHANGLEEIVAFALETKTQLPSVLGEELPSTHYDSLLIGKTKAYKNIAITNQLNCITLSLSMREPQWRFAADWRFRHWMWTKLYGNYEMEIKGLRIGNTIMVGLPCDFSGELMAPLEAYAKSKNKKLIITSFNGGYAGYITPMKYYDQNGYETRVMNWFGPGNGEYFSECVRRMVDVL
jgi:neutral ceramidase